MTSLFLLLNLKGLRMNNSKYVETLNFYAVLAQKTAEKVDPHYSVESIIAETVLFMNYLENYGLRQEKTV